MPKRWNISPQYNSSSLTIFEPLAQTTSMMPVTQESVSPNLSLIQKKQINVRSQQSPQNKTNSDLNFKLQQFQTSSQYQSSNSETVIVKENDTFIEKSHDKQHNFNLTADLNAEQDKVIEQYKQLMANVMGQYVNLHNDFKRMQDSHTN